MSRLIFNGQSQTLALIGKYNYPIGTWPASCQTAAQPYLSDGEYKVLDSAAPYKPEGVELSPSGEYGSFGVIRIQGSGHECVGVHSGREGVADSAPLRATGKDHETPGGLCTTDQAMEAIARTMRQDPLVSLRVVRNEEQGR